MKATVRFRYPEQINEEFRNIEIVGDVLKIEKERYITIVDEYRIGLYMINRGNVRIDFDDGRWFFGDVYCSSKSSDAGFEIGSISVDVRR